MKQIIIILLLSITVSSYSQINTIKVQGVDTAAMLDPYKDDYPRQALSLTTTGSSGAATYNNVSGVINIPQYSGGAASSFWDSVTNIGINYAHGRVGVNNSNPVYKFDVTGNINVVGDSAYRIGGYSAIRARVTDDSYFIGNSGGTGTTGSGNQNTGLGSEALFSITSAQHSTAIGRSALYGVTTGTGNVALGSLALGSIQTSSYNIGVGLSAGEDYNNSAAKNLAGSRSIFIGAFTRAFADAQTNQIVIGDTAWGHGNNSITFGNNNIANTWLKGQINLRGYGSGTYTGTATRTLQVDAGGNVIEGSTSSGIQASDTAAMLAGYQAAINTNTVNVATNTSNIALKLDKSGGTMTGHLLATDNTYDIGASGATRFRTGYFGTSLVSPIGTFSGALSGSTLISSWTNNATFGYETFTSSGVNITSAINSSGYGMASASYSVTDGVRYQVTFTLTLNSGTAPTFGSYNSPNTGASLKSLVAVAGANTVEFTSTRTATEYLMFWLDSGVPSNFSVSSFSIKVLPATISATMGMAVLNGGISAPQNTTSERFGLNADNYSFAKSIVIGNTALSKSDESVVIGYLANSTATGYAAQAFGGQPTIIGSQATGNGTALGYKAQATNFEAIAFGPQSRASAPAAIAIGDAARALPSSGNATVIGDVVWATGSANLVIGSGAGTNRNYVIALGAGGGSVNYDKEIATADHQGFLGWYQQDLAFVTGGAGYINDWWLGGPVTAQAPHAITLNITSGLGTNIAGVNYSINASKATGNAAGGDILFTTSDVGSSGSTLQTATPKFTIKGSGSIIVPTTITTAGTTGAQTINKSSGQVNFAAAATTLVVTNSLVTTSSQVMVTVYGSDATATSARVTKAAGSFTITLNAAATAETAVGFWVIN